MNILSYPVSSINKKLYRAKTFTAILTNLPNQKLEVILNKIKQRNKNL